MSRKNTELTKLTCQLCNLMLLNADAITTHLIGKFHLKTFREELAKLFSEDIQKNEIFNIMKIKIQLKCRACNILLYGQQPILSHLHDDAHLTKVLEETESTSITSQGLDQPKKISSSALKHKKIHNFCHVCQVQMTSETDLNIHLSGRRHLNALRIKQGSTTVKPILSEPLYLKSSNDGKSILKPHERNDLFNNKLELLMETQFTLSCELCSVTIQPLHDIQSHLVDEKHLVAFDKALYQEIHINHSDEAPDRVMESKCRRSVHTKVKFNCNLCSSTVFGAKLISEHLLNKRHNPVLNSLENFNDVEIHAPNGSMKSKSTPLKSVSVIFNSKLKPGTTKSFATKKAVLPETQLQKNPINSDLSKIQDRVQEETTLSEKPVSDAMAISGSIGNSCAKSAMPKMTMSNDNWSVKNITQDNSPSNVFQGHDIVPPSIDIETFQTLVQGDCKENISESKAENIDANKSFPVQVHLPPQQQQQQQSPPPSSQLSTSKLPFLADQLETLKCKKQRKRRAKVSKEKTYKRLMQSRSDLVSFLQFKHKEVCGLASALDYCSVLCCNSTATHRLYNLLDWTPVSRRRPMLPSSAILATDPSRSFANLWELFQAFSLYRIESSINYDFSSKSFLLQAACNSCFEDNDCTDDNVSLSWLGGVTLRLLAVSLASISAPVSAESVEQMVCDTAALSRVCWQHSFPPHLMLCPDCAHIKDLVAKDPVAHEADVSNDDGSSSYSDQAEVTFASFVKAIVGAVYLDSGLSLETVLSVSYKLFASELLSLRSFAKGRQHSCPTTAPQQTKKTRRSRGSSSAKKKKKLQSDMAIAH